MKKLYKIILLIIALALFISCDEKKAEDDIKKAFTKITDKAGDVVDAVDKATPKPQGSGTLTNTKGEDAGGDTPPPPPLTKPALSSYRVRTGQVATFTKVLGHTYELKEEKTGVALTEATGNRMQVTATQAASGVIIVATLDDNTEESDPIEFVDVTLTKPAISAYTLKVGEVATFSKVLGHSYELKQAVNGVTLHVSSGNKGRVTATQAASGVVIVATLDGNTEESDPINFIELTKPVLNSYRVRVGQAATFTKVEGHTYELKEEKTGVTLSEATGNRMQVTATQAASDVIIVATLDDNTEESNPIEFFLFYVASKAELQTEITRAINAEGATANLNYIDTSEVTDMSQLFENNATFNGDISKWDTSSVTNMYAMFSGATSFNQPLNNWDVSSVTTMSSMFYGATSFNQSLNTWKVSSVNYMSAMFSGATSFNQNLNSWDVSRVTNMSAMFSGATVFNQPLNNWTVSIVTNMSAMFSGATSFNQDISGWAASGGRNTDNMFSGATAMQPSNKPRWAR